MMWAHLTTVALFATAAVSAANIQGHTPLQLNTVEPQKSPGHRKLHGRFLHITDIHPDSHYRHGRDPSSRCHHGTGNAGRWGAERTSCDTPWPLVNETFQWIEENLKDQIDFVVWTGDSARHDNDVKIPRTSSEIYESNEKVVNKMIQVFGHSKDAENPHTVPIVPTLGNNDIYPHNIMLPGPSDLTKEYVELWKPFIPEDQYHIFHKGAYFWQQVVPGTNGKTGPSSEGGLVVFSLNTIYFFNSNTAVDGCSAPSEPGYEQMEWLNVQLQLIRERGMKAIIIGHVPPAWTEAKMSWDQSCWKKYVLWSRQYRDVIVAHLYGHMNLDHFMLLDTDRLKPPHLGRGRRSGRRVSAGTCVAVKEFDPEDDPIVSINSAETYLNSLREAFADIVSPAQISAGGGADSSKKNLGGKWAERYVMTLVSPSVVPNYFPTLRVVEYNISGLVDGQGRMLVVDSKEPKLPTPEKDQDRDMHANKDKEGEKPDPPARTAPPGPAYSMQPYTFIGYTQYFLNLTKYNNPTKSVINPNDELRKRDMEEDRKGRGAKLRFEVEYDTRTDKIYKLKDMTVRSYIKLARNIVNASKKHTSNPKDEKQNNSASASLVEESDDDEHSSHDSDSDQEDGSFAAAKKKKNKKHKKKKNRDKVRDKVWHAFVKRAFVGTVNGEALEQYDVRRAECAAKQR